MARIGITLAGMERQLLNRLAAANAEATLSTLRLATGSKINTPSDDPNAFLQLSSLQSQLSQAGTTAANVTAAASRISQVQSTLGSVRTELDTIRSQLLEDEDGGLTPTERDEAQAVVDAALDQINALAATDIDGRRLLDGSADFQTTGRDASQVEALTVRSTGGASLNISGAVTQAAMQAELTYSGKAGLATVNADATFTLTGSAGTATFTVAEDDALADLAAEINQASHQTGVTASVDGDTLTLTSVEYGSDATVEVEVTDGTFNVSGDGGAAGTDVEVTLGGIARVGQGNRVSVHQDRTQYQIEFAAGFSGSFDRITVEGGGLTFALSTDLDHRSTLGIPGVQTARLGGVSGRLSQLADGGSLSGLGGNASQAIRVVDEALADLARIEATVDGFYGAAITSASGLLADLQEDLGDAIDAINLVDETEEEQQVAYYQGLASNATAGLAILTQQRSGIIELLRQIAGLD